MSKLRNHKLTALFALIAMTLSLIASVTPLWIKSGTTLTICSSFGTKTITLDENGKEMPAPTRIKKTCAMCLNASADKALLETHNAEHGIHPYKSEKNPVTGQKRTLEPRTHYAHSARAPPYFS